MSPDTYEDTDWVVEATEYEQEALQAFWEKNPYGFKMPWADVIGGGFAEVGKVLDRPVCIRMRWARVGPLLVCFHEATSTMVDRTMIEGWVKSSFRRAKRVRAIDFKKVALDVRDRTEHA